MERYLLGTTVACEYACRAFFYVLFVIVSCTIRVGEDFKVVVVENDLVFRAVQAVACVWW